MSSLFLSVQTALADRYLLERELGRGGMATVFLAREHKHPRRVAIKILRPELVGVLARERFLREIRISSEFTHPHILPLLDSGTLPASADYPALPFYTMPFVEGESLRDRLVREKQLPVDDALAIARDVAAALGYAHARGVIHRDIKPENILLTGGQAVVADFGIARAIQEAVDPDALTSAGLVVGTPAYMSPEQAGGETTLDGRSDVYSLGCVLYEMLGGDPPFTGSSAQAVLARHRLDSAPSLSTIRQAVPPPIERAVMRALQKSPADRYGTAEQFAEALSARPSGEVEAVPERLRKLPRALIAAACVAGAVVAWWALAREPAGLDANKVVVFPLTEQGLPMRAGTGQEIALMIGSALEHTEPLKWIDGWTWLTPSERADVRQLGAAEAAAIARQQSARYYLDGAVVAATDTSRVILRLNDAQGDSVVSQVTAAGVPDSATFPQLGLRAINLLLPRLLEPGRPFDLTALAERRPAAIADWLQGERAYRRSRYALALEYQRRAVAADSSLAYAALKGALAAEWQHEYGEAVGLVDLALRNDSVLPLKYRHFATGLREYFAGHADSAARHLEDALRLDSAWSEGWMALGEVRYHLFTGAESLAAEAFSRARRADPEFAPPLFHLAEISLRNGDTTDAAALIARFRQTDPDSLWLEQLTMTLDCLRRPPGGDAWGKAAAHFPLEVVQAAKVLASRGAHTACAEAGFRSVLTAESAPPTARWGAVLGLQGILTARGELDSVKLLLDSAVVAGVMAAKGLYVIHAAAGHGMDAEAATVINELGGEYTEMGSGRLWYHGIWLAHRGDRANLARVARAMSRQADSSRSQLDNSTARSIAARLALLGADTAGAIALLRGVVPSGDRVQIEWGMRESFGQEQLLLAELLFARGQAAEALRVADRLDHPRPILYLVYLRQSLLLRVNASERLGRPDLTARYQHRLAMLTE